MISALPTPAAPAARSAQLERALVAAFMENIPDKIFFKDRQSRFVAVSRSMLVNFRAARPEDVLGRSDFDFFAAEHAQAAFDDEQRILRTGEPILNKVEKESWPDRPTTWSLTSKLPLRNARGAIIGTFGLSQDITRTRELELALEKAHRELVSASRLAGMAEVATGVLHNVGNVLSSLNVSATLITGCLRQSKADGLAKIAALLRENAATLGDFLADDPRGQRVPEVLRTLARLFAEQRERLTQEISSLQRNIDHIKEIVFLQQDYATMGGLMEPLDAVALMEDALRMNADTLARNAVEVAREFTDVPRVLGERGKILQILVNLVRNAKHACRDSGQPGMLITLRVAVTDSHRVQLIVADNGVGIPAENLIRIFGHGFTTRVGGHGFGLHSAANAAREMKGSLTVHSEGPGQGATFTLDLPAAP